VTRRGVSSESNKLGPWDANIHCICRVVAHFSVMSFVQTRGDTPSLKLECILNIFRCNAARLPLLLPKGQLQPVRLTDYSMALTATRPRSASNLTICRTRIFDRRSQSAERIGQNSDEDFTSRSAICGQAYSNESQFQQRCADPQLTSSQIAVGYDTRYGALVADRNRQ